MSSGRTARVEADGSAGCNAKAPKVLPLVPLSKGLGFPIRLPTIVELQEVNSCPTRVQAFCCPLSIGASKADLGLAKGLSAP